MVKAEWDVALARSLAADRLRCTFYQPCLGEIAEASGQMPTIVGASNGRAGEYALEKEYRRGRADNVGSLIFCPP